VKDTGIGIPKNRVNTIFKSFSQADNTTSRKFGGTGLGLAISQKLVEMMQGEIWAKSEVNKGSTFYFTAKFSSSKKSGPDKNIILTSNHHPKILVVDDNETNRLILQEMLNSFDFIPTIFESGNRLLKYLEKNSGIEGYDLIITDFNMPGMNGVELLSIIRKKSKIPAIILTSIGALGENYKLKKMRNIAQLTKPVKQSYLFDTIVNLLGDNKQPKSLTRDKNAIISQDITQLKSLKEPVKILLAEDNFVNQKLALALIKKTGLAVDVADDGIKALEALQKRHYHLVLMDVQMPNMDGLIATKKIRNELGFEKIPIVAMTANAMKGDKEKCLDAGMNDYISKPINPDELYRKLKFWLVDKKVTAH